MAYNYEAFGVNAVCKALDFCNFTIGNNGQNNFGFVMFITGFRMKKGYAAVDFGKNCFGNFLCLSGDDFDFGSGFSEYKGFIENIGISEGEDNSVKDKIDRFKHCKKNYNDKIECIKACGNGDMEKFVQNKGRNIHSTGGSSGTEYKSKCKAYSDSAKNRTKKNVIGKIIIAKNTVAYFKKNRVAEGAENGCHCKCFSENKETDTKHYNVKYQNKSGNRDIEKMFNDKCNTGCSAKGNSGRKNKKLYGQSVDDISENNADIWEEFLPEIFNFIHLNSPFVIIKKRLPRIFPDKRGSRLSPNT